MSTKKVAVAKAAATKSTNTAVVLRTDGSSIPATNGQAVPEDAIRLGAYLKWEAAGKPVGDGVKYWLESERDLSRRSALK